MTVHPAPAKLTLTLDELRALARLAGYWLPADVTDDDDADMRIDLAAVRGLAARGLLPGEEPLAGALEPLTGPRTAVEIDADEAGTRRWYAASGDTSTTVLAGRHDGLVDVGLLDGSPAAVVPRLLLLPDAHVDTTGFDVDADALAEADELVAAGADGAALDVLRRAGVPAGPATRWLRAITGRRFAAAVRVAHHDAATGRFVADELRWLVAGDGTGWQVTTIHSGRHRVAPADPGDVREALDHLLSWSASCRVP
ncbi:hypothetical protein [Dactylosporangium sp. NPDC050588]|uniref:hypothetical protein n=1 Tax=Dactylosporangium sp. NPDC050588 TaxID=3157211 RepID=UPI0033C0FBC3